MLTGSIDSVDNGHSHPVGVASDRLWQRPLPIVDGLFEYPELAEVVLRMCRMFRQEH